MRSVRVSRGSWGRPALWAFALLVAGAPLLPCHETVWAEADEVASISDYAPVWRPAFVGIDLAEARKTGSPSQAAYAARIALRAPGIEFLATPSNGDKPLDTDARTTSAFLEEFGCQLAVNASPFKPVRSVAGEARDILGLSISCGDAYSPCNNLYGAMLISRDNKVSIAMPPFDLDGVYNAVAGFSLLLRDGENVGTDGDRHPRTAAGVSEDGKYLYLIVIDGRQGHYSGGATTRETAAWLKQLGAHDGLNLDGGGSTTLVIDDGGGRAKVLNRPIHNRIPGMERVNGNHLGVFAQPLTKGG
ncbi:MAG: phosphodiester glycosidase family protein [Nitrospiraceae bacterium]|nr:phosphodiester glycosidase family protein [Nitrospiraceae bacterium]